MFQINPGCGLAGSGLENSKVLWAFFLDFPEAQYVSACRGSLELWIGSLAAEMGGTQGLA